VTVVAFVRDIGAFVSAALKTERGQKLPGTADGDWRRDAQHPPGGHPTGGGADLCLRWSGSIESAAELLREHGLPIIDGRPADGLPALSIYFRDPDGNLLELMAADGTAAE
jgi:catechol 2,3-dioxygenase-like lactoylglutathione lyase family enzyme